MNGWFAVVAPAGIDRQIVDKLNKEIAEYLKESGNPEPNDLLRYCD